jgi:hypothetical protein
MLSLIHRQTQTLNAAMKAAGRQYIGTSLTVRNDNTEQSIIRSEFGSITPENAMKWDATEPNRGQFNFGSADQHVNWATQNSKEIVRRIWAVSTPFSIAASGARQLSCSSLLLAPGMLLHHAKYPHLKWLTLFDSAATRSSGTRSCPAGCPTAASTTRR